MIKKILEYIKRLLLFILFVLFGIIAIGIIIYVAFKDTIHPSIPTLKIATPTFDLYGLLMNILTFSGIIFGIFILYWIYKLSITMYEKKNYRYYQIAMSVHDYSMDEKEYYNRQVRFLKDIHGTYRPWYSALVFGKMRFALYVICSGKDDQLEFFYAIHKNREHLLIEFFRIHFPNSELFAVESNDQEERTAGKFQIPCYKYNRKVFSHMHSTFNDDYHEVMQRVFSIMKKDSMLCIEVQKESKFLLNQYIKHYSYRVNKKARDNENIDGLAKNEKKESLSRLRSDDVAFNVNITASSQHQSYINFVYQLKTASKAHNELKIYRWPNFIYLVQKVPSMYWSKTYMTDKELATIMRAPHESEE